MDHLRKEVNQVLCSSQDEGAEVMERPSLIHPSLQQTKEEAVHPPLPLDQALLPHKERQEVHQAETVLLPSQEEEMSQEVHQVQQGQALLLQQKDQEEGLQDGAQMPLLNEEEMPGPQVQAVQALQKRTLPQLHQVLLCEEVPFPSLQTCQALVLQPPHKEEVPQDVPEVLLCAQEEVSPPQMQAGNTLLCEQKDQEEVLQEGAPVPLHSPWLLPQVPYVKALHQEQKD